MRPTILVGLGGSGGWHALAWAIDEATVVGARLVLCHACPPDSPLAGRGPATPISLVELVDPPLARAVASARASLGGDRVDLQVLAGRPGPVLVAAATHADLVVLGAPDPVRPRRPRGPAHHVARHAPCPVVVNRPVGPHRHAALSGHVVVGVDDSAAGRAALDFGFGYAERHRRPLAAVRVTEHTDDDLWFDERTLSTHFATEPADLALLAAEVEPWMRKYPAVAVKRALYGGRPLPGLLRATGGATLLVVGDHGHGGVVRAILGSVSDGALDDAGCPVAVVHGYEWREATR